MKLLEFVMQFFDEASCIAKLKEIRDKEDKYGGNGMTNFMLPNLKAETGSYQICIQGIYPSRN